MLRLTMSFNIFLMKTKQVETLQSLSPNKASLGALETSVRMFFLFYNQHGNH